MEEESKYYTPTIEEFRVGFSYEYKNHTGTVRDLTSLPWIKSTIKSINELAYVERGLSIEGNTRVKLLDIEDIEEVGFNNFTDSRGWWRGFMKINEEEYIVIHLGRNIVLEKKRKVDNDLYAHPNILFAGKIKNKSELQQILKMVL